MPWRGHGRELHCPTGRRWLCRTGRSLHLCRASKALPPVKRTRCELSRSARSLAGSRPRPGQPTPLKPHRTRFISSTWRKSHQSHRLGLADVRLGILETRLRLGCQGAILHRSSRGDRQGVTHLAGRETAKQVKPGVRRLLDQASRQLGAGLGERGLAVQLGDGEQAMRPRTGRVASGWPFQNKNARPASRRVARSWPRSK